MSDIHQHTAKCYATQVLRFAVMQKNVLTDACHRNLHLLLWITVPVEHDHCAGTVMSQVDRGRRFWRKMFWTQSKQIQVPVFAGLLLGITPCNLPCHEFHTENGYMLSTKSQYNHFSCLIALLVYNSVSSSRAAGEGSCVQRFRAIHRRSNVYKGKCI
jgi:hypothetical protein